MKKIWFGVIVLLLTTTVFAKIGVKDQEVETSLIVGLLTDKDFKFDPIYPFFGVVVDIHALDFILISPEFAFYFPKLFNTDDNFYLAPGITINFSPGDPGTFFVGGGISKRFNIFTPPGSPTIAVPLDLKLNFGLRTHNRKLRLGGYILTPFKDTFKTMAFGLYIGFGFFFT
jgi:hypothetical protein